LAYHHRAKCCGYHLAFGEYIISHRLYHFRNDDIQRQAVDLLVRILYNTLRGSDIMAEHSVLSLLML